MKILENKKYFLFLIIGIITIQQIQVNFGNNLTGNNFFKITSVGKILENGDLALISIFPQYFDILNKFLKTNNTPKLDFYHIKN